MSYDVREKVGVLLIVLLSTSQSFASQSSLQSTPTGSMEDLGPTLCTTLKDTRKHKSATALLAEHSREWKKEYAKLMQEDPKNADEFLDTCITQNCTWAVEEKLKILLEQSWEHSSGFGFFKEVHLRNFFDRWIGKDHNVAVTEIRYKKLLTGIFGPWDPVSLKPNFVDANRFFCEQLKLGTPWALEKNKEKMQVNVGNKRKKTSKTMDDVQGLRKLY